jgi:predicted RNA-binding protein associated with RNAse of E/G family
VRPPGRIQVYVQEVVHDDGRVKVTYARALELPEPLVVNGTVVLESGSDAVWFTFPGAWHDIGRFHRADGRLTGIYANVLVPCTFEPGEWLTTDLFLDLWIPARADGTLGAPTLLDEDELEHAERSGWVGPELAGRAREEANRLLDAAAAGTWPPAVVEEWTLERARAVARR